MMLQCMLVLEVHLYSRDDIKNDESFGFKIIHCDEFQTEGTDKIAERIKKRVGNNPLIFIN